MKQIIGWILLAIPFLFALGMYLRMLIKSEGTREGLIFFFLTLGLYALVTAWIMVATYLISH